MSLPKIIKMGAIAAAVIGSGVASAQDFITIGTGSGYWCLLPYGRRYL
ncbi:immunogenic protein [Vibrio cholerae]|nr:immunogenic protein [Vibrio cholerae]